MAPVLQCPDCGTKHPIDVASDAAAFRCSGCGRTLKVPAQFRAAVPAPPPPAAAPASPDATAAMPRTDVPRSAPAPSPNGRVLSRRKVRAQAGVVPSGMRVLMWIVAVPLGFVIVFGLARAFGFLSTKELEDVFLEDSWDRFWPVARLLPFVALVTASIVHFSVLYVSRWRVRHAMAPLQPKSAQPSARETARPAR